MEARKITVVSTKTQSKKVIMSGAETLSELKQDLDAAGVDYADMTFYEGTSKTELISNDSVLPKDVPYTNRTTGETIITNELVFMLTNSNKKIKSGAYSRKELYIMIKESGLQNKCKEVFGRNFTQCANSELALLIEKANEQCTHTNPLYAKDYKAREAIVTLSQLLFANDCISEEDVNNIAGTLDIVMPKKDITSSYSDNEIENMFKDLK